MFEFEKKVIISQREYAAILKKRCADKPSVTQTNYYFDDHNYSMNKKGITCRVRSKNGSFKSTIKKHSFNNLDCSFEKDLETAQKFNINAFKYLGLNFQGCLVTERTEVFCNEYCQMVLDKNIYLGVTDYELEIEYLKENENMARYLLLIIADDLVKAKINSAKNDLLSRVKNSKNKSERFFERKIREESKGAYL